MVLYRELSHINSECTSKHIRIHPDIQGFFQLKKKIKHYKIVKTLSVFCNCFMCEYVLYIIYGKEFHEGKEYHSVENRG